MKPMKLLKDPITRSVPLLIKNTDELTMSDIANNTYLPKSHLSPVAQQLYDCISGKSFVLNGSDFPDFSKAIEYSIATPGLWCYEKLKEKSTEFNKDDPNILETYLRITLNENNGESPGIPYVMEIWPVGHYSPIHNHGGSSAVVRVLNGKINVKLYPFLCYDDKDGVEPFKEVQVVQDEVTWISPTLNQIHQLHNLESNKDTCITIQCYMYENDDSIHYDYFDYLDNKGKKQNYEPDSDMDFILFKETMKQEWESRNSVVKSTTIKKWTSIFSSCGKE
jgi:predicted metal-dependent enzyme (double-stranded beta helix superfamily)